MNENSIPKQLLNRDLERLRGYREYLDFYNGRHWAVRATRGEKRLTFNYAKVFIDKATSYLMSGISFAVDVLPILQRRCIVCHGEERREQGLDLTSYSAVVAGSDSGPIIVAGDAENSLIVELVLAGRMPKRAPRLIPTQVQILIEWINQGALDN